MFEMQQKAIRAQEDMAAAMRTRPTSSSSAPNLPGLTGGAARQAGAEADARWGAGWVFWLRGEMLSWHGWRKCWGSSECVMKAHDQWCAVVLWSLSIPAVKPV